MNAEELYQARAKRIRDDRALKVPDRVPVTATFDPFSARYCGYTQEQLMYDPDVLWDAQLRTTMKFKPDLARNPFPGMLLGRLLDVLDCRQLRWPGRQLAAHLPFRFVEGEYMSAEEYDHSLSESTDFMVRKYWPRIDGFMFAEQFKRFYWPTLRDLTIGLIDERMTSYLFWEGDCTSRLPLIKDIPPGKVVHRFEATDMMKAKDIVGERICIWGSVPVSILGTATPEDVRAYCKRPIDYAGKSGGLIMGGSAGVNDAKVGNVRAMFDFTKEYGIYASSRDSNLSVQTQGCSSHPP
jgi:hypothetical protein